MEFIVAGEEAGQRLDVYLVAQLPSLSRSRIRTLIDEGHVEVDGAPRKASHHVEAGEMISVAPPEQPPAGVAPEPIPLEILYQDSDIAVVNKPAGMIVHPGAGVTSGSMVAALLHRFGPAGLSCVGGPLRPGIVHRLDKETSGAIVVACTDAAHRKLVEDFRDRRVKKTYLALLHGKIKSDTGSIDLPVSRDLRRRSRMTTRRRDGRPARTDWRVRLRLPGFSLIEADLRTGRTHQIRVHFSALGRPVVGDTLYGAPRQEAIQSALLPPLGRNFLHAARLGFAHPRTGKRIEVRARLPVELHEYLRIVARASKTDSSLIDAALQEFL